MAVIRSVLEYAAPVWHHSLNKSQADKLEAIQKRAINIIYPVTYKTPYDFALHIAELDTLVKRREQLSREFFNSLTDPTSCLHMLLPDPRDSTTIVTRLRAAAKYPRLPSRTRKYQSFLSYALSHYQNQ